MKEKIGFTKAEETLLIPLYSKAQANPILDDPKAREILAQVDYDFSRLEIPQKTEVTLRIRAKQLDQYARDFIAQHRQALILHLGCGLDSRCERVDRQDALWVDLDMPDVIALREKFYPQTETYRLVGSSVTDLGWMDQVPGMGRPTLVIAEGLLMYLSETEVRALVTNLSQHYPGCHLACDAFSRYTVTRIERHPSIQKTGAHIQWGIDDPHEMESWLPTIRLIEEWFFSQSADIAKLSGFYRVMFRLTAGISIAQRAQRLLYYRL